MSLSASSISTRFVKTRATSPHYHSPSGDFGFTMPTAPTRPFCGRIGQTACPQRTASHGGGIVIVEKFLHTLVSPEIITTPKLKTPSRNRKKRSRLNWNLTFRQHNWDRSINPNTKFDQILDWLCESRHPIQRKHSVNQHYDEQKDGRRCGNR